MQNWRQRAIYRTEDTATLEMVQKLLGKVDVHVTGESSSQSSGVGRSVQNSGESHSTNQSSSYGHSKSIQQQYLFDSNDFRKLDAKFALFIGNIGDKAADEVLEMQPFYVNK